MADQAKKGNKASADDKLKFLASIVKNSDISSVDWTLVAQDLGCIEGTLLKRWQGLRNEFLPGLTLKKMRAEDGVKPKAKTGGRGKGKAAAQVEGENGARVKGAGKRKKTDEVEDGGDQKKARVSDDESPTHVKTFTDEQIFTTEEEHQQYLDEALDGYA